MELSQWDFIKNLLSNGPHIEGDHNKIPNASFFCLQILAFWLSWTRKLYSKDGILREVFGTGTAVTVAPVKSITLGESKIVIPYQEDSFALKLKKDLQNIQKGRTKDIFNWTNKVC